MARRVMNPSSATPGAVAELAFASSPVRAPEASTETVGIDTRERLLESAGEVFAARGYQSATIREICNRARANVAAVNYHFGDKESLYEEVLTFAFRFSIEKYPLGMGTQPTAPAEERIAAFVKNYLDRLLDEGRPAWHGQLIAREMVEPTAALDKVIEQFVRPQHDGLWKLVTELLQQYGGSTPDQANVRHGANSVVGQCLFYKNCRRIIGKLMPETDFSAAGRKVLAEHITAMSIAGLKAIASAKH
jgi:AcrR family transcriptional regulator